MVVDVQGLAATTTVTTPMSVTLDGHPAERFPKGASSGDATPVSNIDRHLKSFSVDEVSPGGEALESRDGEAIQIPKPYSR